MAMFVLGSDRLRGEWNRINTASGCEPNILASCRQINREANNIMDAGNTICLMVTVGLEFQPIFDKELLSGRVLPGLTSLLLVVDNRPIDLVVNEASVKEEIH